MLASCQVDKVFEKHEIPIKEFMIAPSADTILFGAQGTRIFIGPKTFQFENGILVKDSVRIQLKECYKMSDIVLGNLTTESNGTLLETAGMVNIKAFSNGEALEIHPDKRLVVHFPKEKKSYKKMDLFYADSTATDSSVTNWTIDTVSLVKRTLKLSSFGWWHPSSTDSTEYHFIPKNFVDTGYYWNPLNFYVKSYDFSNETIKEIGRIKNVNTYPGFESWNDYGVECEMYVSTKGFIKAPKIVTNLSRSAKREILNFLKKLPQLEPGKNKYGEIIQRRGLLFIKPGNIVPLYETQEEYLKSFDEKYAKFENTPIKNIDDAELNFYIFSISKLGWINCDIFMEFEDKTDLIVDTNLSEEVSLKLVFSDLNGALKPKIKNGKYVFEQVPIGEKATIVGIKNNNHEFTAAFEAITISDQKVKGLKFNKTSLSDLREKLDAI